MREQKQRPYILEKYLECWRECCKLQSTDPEKQKQRPSILKTYHECWLECCKTLFTDPENEKSLRIMKPVAFGTLAAFALAIVWFSSQSRDASSGKAFLEQKGICTYAEGGEKLSLFNMCGRGISRTYQCVDRNNQLVKRTVCFVGFIKYQPLLER